MLITYNKFLQPETAKPVSHAMTLQRGVHAYKGPTQPQKISLILLLEESVRRAPS